ncbi:hypothetical protein [Haladaptatus salinisoli]|uniref:hypothetical protein n=1 Tax=Haladaptatus salinisoli TaxID=2884876 RepID=UPI001D0AC849|nr:hypothetical protein [Haladaptatus salinisoli]
MHIITFTCPECSTIVAANELEKNRVMKCPGLNCRTVLRFEDLPENEQEHFLEYRDQYQI